MMFLMNFGNVQLSALLFFVQAADSPAGNFKELGQLFLWGILGAVAVAVVVVVIWLKIQSKRDGTTNYTSINPSKHV